MPNKNVLRTSIICLSLINFAFQVGQPSLPWQEPLGYRASELYPITIGKYGYPYVTVSVNGQDLKLVWDTGNMSGLALNSDVAERLKLPVIGDSKSVDSSGRVIGTARLFQVSKLRAFGGVWTDVQALEIRTTDFDGLLGPLFLSGKRFTLDYPNRVIAISDTPLPSRGEANAAILPMTQSARLKGMILVGGFVNGRRVLIQIDTGKSRTCVDPSLVVLDKLPESGNGYKIGEVKIGPYSFSVPSARQIDFKGISEGLPEPILLGIGSDILSRLVLTVDYSRQIVRVTE
jgi:hypothetical protein